VNKNRLIDRGPKSSNRLKTFSMGILALCLVQAASADVLLTEYFDYANGDLLTVSGGAWVKSSGSSPLNVLDGQAVVTFANTDDDYRAFSPLDEGSLYYGFTVQTNTAPTTTGSYIAALWDGDTGADTDFFGRLQVARGSTASKVKYGIINESPNAVVYYTASEFDLGTSIQVVVRFDFSTMTSTLWLNPIDESSTSVTDTVAAEFTGPASTLGNMLLRQASGVGSSAVDNLAVATTFDGAIAPVPEPSTWALLVAGAGVFCLTVYRKRPVNR
jgi:hypothetical protein